MDEGICIVDMEAGLELFGRGTPSASNLLLMVVDPSRWSIETAVRISMLARELGIPKLAAVANKVHDEVDVEWIRGALRPHDVDVLAVVPYDSAVTAADRRMRALVDEAPESAAARAITLVADSIAADAGATAGVAQRSSQDGAAAGKPGEDGCPWVVDKV